MFDSQAKGLASWPPKTQEEIEEEAKETERRELLERIRRQVASGELTLVPQTDEERRELLERLRRERAAIQAAKETERRELIERLRRQQARKEEDEQRMVS